MRRLGDDARRLLASAGVAPAGELGPIASVWEVAVGEGIARAAWPARVARDGTLHVATTSSAWAFELGQLSSEIADRLRSALGEAAPRALRFAPGPVPAAAGEPAHARRDPPLASPEDRSRAAELAAPIDDAELRSLVARAVAASLARAAADRRFC